MNRLFNIAIETMRPSLIRSIMDTEHHGAYSRISLGLGELPFPMPAPAQSANRNAIKAGHTHYTANAGLPELRRAIASDFSTRQKVHVQPEQIMVTAGSTGGIFIAFETLLNPGDEVLIPALRYPIYENIPLTNGAQVREYTLGKDFAIDVDDVLAHITPKTKLIVLNSPSNPTGRIQSRQTLRKLAEGIAGHPELFILSDEIYSSCLYSGATHTSITEFTDRAIVVDGLSKRASMTGKRLGWLIGPKEFVKQALKVQQYAYTCAPTDSQYAALAVLSGACDDELAAFQQILSKNRGIMLKGLVSIPNITVNEPNGAFYCLINTSQFGTSVEVATRLVESVNVVTVPGLAFGRAGDEYLRLSFAGSPESITEGLARIKEVLK